MPICATIMPEPPRRNPCLSPGTLLFCAPTGKHTLRGPPENAQTFQYMGRAQSSPSAAQEWKFSFRYLQKICGIAFKSAPSAVWTFPCAPAEACTGRCVPGPARHSPGGERPDSIDREKQRGLFMGIKNTAPCHFPEEGLKAQGVRPSSNR